MAYLLVCLLQNMSSVRTSTRPSHPSQGNYSRTIHLLNEWLNNCFIPVNFLTLFPHRISIWFFIKGKKLKGRKTTAPGQEFVAEKPQPGRKRDSAGGTPFHALARRARLS